MIFVGAFIYAALILLLWRLPGVENPSFWNRVQGVPHILVLRRSTWAPVGLIAWFIGVILAAILIHWLVADEWSEGVQLILAGLEAILIVWGMTALVEAAQTLRVEPVHSREKIECPYIAVLGKDQEIVALKADMTLDYDIVETPYPELILAPYDAEEAILALCPLVRIFPWNEDLQEHILEPYGTLKESLDAHIAKTMELEGELEDERERGRIAGADIIDLGKANRELAAHLKELREKGTSDPDYQKMTTTQLEYEENRVSESLRRIKEAREKKTAD